MTLAVMHTLRLALVVAAVVAAASAGALAGDASRSTHATVTDAVDDHDVLFDPSAPPSQDGADTPPQKQHFPDRTTDPVLAESAVSVVASVPLPTGNVDVYTPPADAGDGGHESRHLSDAATRVFFTVHPAGRVPGVDAPQLAEALPDSDPSYKAFPSEAWQATLQTPLAVRVKPDDASLWVLDHANLGLSETKRPTLHVIDLATDTHDASRDYVFPEASSPKGSMLNDFVIGPTDGRVYVADCGIASGVHGIVVFDPDSRSSWRVLHQHATVMPVVALPRINGVELDLPWHVGVDSITIRKVSSDIGNARGAAENADNEGFITSASGSHMEQLVYSSIYAKRFSTIGLDKLAEAQFNGGDAGALPVQPDPHSSLMRKTVSDGIVAAPNGTIYITDFEHNAIARLSPSGKLETLVTHPLLRWPDGIAISAAGDALYVTASAIHEVVAGDHATNAPFHVLKVALGDTHDRRRLAAEAGLDVEPDLECDNTVRDFDIVHDDAEL